MKISTLAISPVAFLHLKGPDGNLLYDGAHKVGIDLFGPGSPEFARVEERQSARLVKRYRDNDNQLSHVPIEELRSQAAEDLTSLTSAFHHIEHDGPDGSPLAGAALFTAIYADPSFGWLKEQVAKFVRDWGKFTPGSATS